MIGGEMNKAQHVVGSVSSNGGVAGSAIPRGNDGISPIVTVTDIEGGHRITIKDIYGTKHFDVMNGIDGNAPDTQEIVEAVMKNIGSIARVGYVELPASKWVGEASPYAQVVVVEGATEYSQVDLTPSVEQLAVFHDKDLAFVTENEDGVVTVYAIGQKPTNDYTIQVTITEVDV
jgi:hypothetical protein